jgi:hypothetical protein
MNNTFDSLYGWIIQHVPRLGQLSTPYLERVFRFLALPYAYFFLVNWKECTVSPWQVFKDFLYIFFILKDYPNYYTVFRFWEKDRSEWKYYYGSNYNPYQKARLRKEVQRKEYQILFDDKYVCHQLCSHANLPLPELIGYLQPTDDFRSIIKKLLADNPNRRLIIKNSRGKGGKNIFLASHLNEVIRISDGKQNIPLDDFQLKYTSVIQEQITQHPELNRISKSVNTVRIETLLTREKEVILLGAFIRFGLNNHFLDNQCAGGLSVGVDLDNGTLYESAMNSKGEKFYNHPDSGFKFQGYVIPFWKEIVELSKRVQSYFSYYKLVGSDIAVSPQGPVLIEINAIPDHAGLEMDYGPVLKSEKVWKEFKKYDLLINRVSQNLFE